MQAVIIAAGRGERFGKLTKNTPKCLLKVLNKPIIFYVLESLPEAVSEILIVTGPLGEQIKSAVGNEFSGKPIKFTESSGYNGTAGAVWDAKNSIKNEFLVLNSDDILPQAEIACLLNHPLAFGIAKHIPPRPTYLEVVVENEIVKEFRRLSPEQVNQEINIATGTYKLDRRIFDYEPVSIKNGTELGLPQTILKLAQDTPVHTCLIKHWLSINNPEELQAAEKQLSALL